MTVFLHVETRRAFLTPATAHPNEAWVCEQAKAFVKDAQVGRRHVMHDRDTRFCAAFDAELQNAGLRIQNSAVRSPYTVAFVERFIQTLGQERLGDFVVFGERRLNHLCSVLVDYYHLLRPHHGKKNELLVSAKPKRNRKPPPPATIPLSEVRCEQRLGGLLKHYYRKAA